MTRYEHKVIKVYFKGAERLESELAVFQKQGWEVAGVGQSLGSMVIVLKRPRPPGRTPPVYKTEPPKK